ncbi:MAG TPA: pectinesterase family protein, partial [Chitinophagaceae bacterium]|nr:pectinesterase family protein [Chitinophagaceae bacterium]
MRLVFLILFTFLSIAEAVAQSLAGITGKPDTSFSLHSAYINTKKTHPDITIVEEFHSPMVAEKRNIVYCTNGKRQLLLDAFYPKEKSTIKRKAILIIHGGGWRTGNRAMHYALAQRLAAMGYVCFTPEYRLSTEALYPAAVYDIKSALRWIRKNAKEYNIDTAAVAALGHSAGGELAAFMGATNNNSTFEVNNCNPGYSSKVNTVVDIDGILAFIHPESGEGDDSKRISAATNWFGYSKTENPELWKQGSALTHAGSHVPPVLFLNSSVDRMHAGREDYIRILDHYKIYSEVKTFEGAPHSFCLFEPWFEPMVKDIDAFLKKVFDKQKPVSSQTIIVAKDGSGKFTTVQAALDAVPLNNKIPITIFIKNGIYKEKLHLDSSKNFVT